ncbi:MAG: DUF2628 domain-containing protein [Gammaproteobacteria bacterium]
MDNLYQPPGAALETEDSNAAIDTLEVSERWRNKFRLIAKAGPLPGFKYANLKVLTVRERNAIGFNILAFLFSFLYYIFKGMHRRALVLLGFGWLYISIVSFVELYVDFSVPTVVYWIPLSAVAAALANRDYYDTRVAGLHMWPSLRVFESWIACIVLGVFGFATLLVPLWLFGGLSGN